MKKLIKILAIIVGGLLLLLLLAALILPKIIDPNDFKPEIAALIEKNTGYRVDFNGPISLEVLPTLQISLQDVRVLPATAAFGETPLVSVERAALRAALLPLLSRRVEVESVLLSGAQVNLLTNRQGANSWDMPARSADGAAEAPAAGAATSSGVGFEPRVDELRLENCTVNVKNDREGQNFSLLVNALALDNVGFGQDMGILLDLAYNDKTADRGLGVKLSGKAGLDRQAHSAYLDIPSLTLSLRGPTQKAADTVNGKLKADAKLAGAADLADGLDCLANLDLELGDINLDGFLADHESVTGGSRAAPAASNGPPDSSGPAGGPLKGTPLEKSVINGRFAISGLTVQKIPLRAIKGNLTLNRGVAELKPLNLTCFDGLADITGRADLLRPRPPVQVTASLKGLDLLQAGQTVAGIDKISGKVNLETALRFEGLDGASIKRSLNGNGRIDSDKSAPIRLRGFQLIPADAPAALLQFSRPDYAFDSLAGSFTATNGVIRNSDLALLSSEINVRGGGTVNLPANSIDYRAIIAIGKLALPVKAVGPLNNISYGLDAEALGKEVVGGVLREVTKDGKSIADELKKNEAVQNLGKDLQKIMNGGKK